MRSKNAVSADFTSEQILSFTLATTIPGSVRDHTSQKNTGNPACNASGSRVRFLVRLFRQTMAPCCFNVTGERLVFSWYSLGVIARIFGLAGCRSCSIRLRDAALLLLLFTGTSTLCAPAAPGAHYASQGLPPCKALDSSLLCCKCSLLTFVLWRMSRRSSLMRLNGSSAVYLPGDWVGIWMITGLAKLLSMYSALNSRRLDTCAI